MRRRKPEITRTQNALSDLRKMSWVFTRCHGQAQSSSLDESERGESSRGSADSAAPGVVEAVGAEVRVVGDANAASRRLLEE